MQHAPFVLLTEIIFKLLLDYSLYFCFSGKKLCSAMKLVEVYKSIHGCHDNIIQILPKNGVVFVYVVIVAILTFFRPPTLDIPGRCHALYCENLICIDFFLRQICSGMMKKEEFSNGEKTALPQTLQLHGVSFLLTWLITVYNRQRSYFCPNSYRCLIFHVVLWTMFLCCTSLHLILLMELSLEFFLRLFEKYWCGINN